MADDVRRTWNNEQWVIARLIEAVEAGLTDAKPALGQRLLEGIWNDGWTAWKWVEEGPYLPLQRLDPVSLSEDDLAWLRDKGAISAERKAEICKGARLKRSELERWREMVVDQAFEPELPASWAIFQTRRGLRTVCVAATLTQLYVESPDEQIAPTFVAAYETFTEALNALKSNGFVGRRDYMLRSAEVLKRR
ncbi:MAG TPA: hypothetical protein VGF24_27220 [Vicinamibacterales bacterium]